MMWITCKHLEARKFYRTDRYQAINKRPVPKGHEVIGQILPNALIFVVEQPVVVTSSNANGNLYAFKVIANDMVGYIRAWEQDDRFQPVIPEFEEE